MIVGAYMRLEVPLATEMANSQLVGPRVRPEEAPD
jgi:hypothetical protein